MFDVRFVNPMTKCFDILRAKHCKGRESYISESIIARNRLWGHVQNGNISLAWNEIQFDAASLIDTRFKLVADEKIENDMAISTEYKLVEDISHLPVEEFEQTFRLDNMSSHSISREPDSTEADEEARLNSNAKHISGNNNTPQRGFRSMSEHEELALLKRSRQLVDHIDDTDSDPSSKRTRSGG